MGTGILYCAECGDRLVEADFKKGTAVTLHNKTYCSKCVSTIAGGPRGSSALLKPVGSPAGAATKIRPASPTRSAKAPTDRSTPAKNSALPMIAVGAVIAAAIGGLLVMTMGGSDPGTRPPPAPAPASVKAPKADDEAQRHLAEDVRRLRESAALPSSRPADILKEASRLKPLVAGTRWEGEIARILEEAGREKASADAATEFDAAMRRIGEVRASDRGFEKRDEVRSQIARAKELAARLTSGRREEAEKIEQEYHAAFIEYCQKAYESAVQTADIWERDGRFDEAIDAIEKTFPPHLRESSYWQDLERRLSRYRDQKARKEAAPAPSTSPTPKPVLEREDMPPAGKPFVLFDGTGLDRFAKVGKAADAWKVDGKELVGECTTREAAGQAIFDLLVTKADGFVHYEIEFEAKVEAGALLFLGRINETGDRGSGIGAMQAVNTGEWTRFKFVFSSEGFTGQRGENAPVKLQVQPGVDKGRPGFAMTGGSKVRVRNVRITPRD